jgi:uncharacterized membrane protein HdeD (DUF308 family)
MALSRTAFDMSTANVEIRAKWGWFVALGAVLLAMGLLALGNVILATVAAVISIGAMMIIGAAAQIIHAFQVKSWPSFNYFLLSGLLYGLAAYFVFRNPLFAAATLTLYLGIALIASGAMRIWSSFQLRPVTGWGWVLASGLVTLLAGIVFVGGWPVNTLWLLGMYLAFDLIFQGVAALGFGFALKTKS